MHPQLRILLLPKTHLKTWIQFYIYLIKYAQKLEKKAFGITFDWYWNKYRCPIYHVTEHGSFIAQKTCLLQCICSHPLPFLCFILVIIVNVILSLLFNRWIKCVLYLVSFPFLTHGLENKFLLQVCLRLFVSYFSIQVFLWRLQLQAVVLHEYVLACCKTPAWMARNSNFRASVSQWICLRYGN